MREDQLGFRRPGACVVFGSHQHKIAVGIGVTVAFFTERPAIGRTAESNQQLAVGPANYRRKGAVELVVLIDDQFCEFRWLSPKSGTSKTRCNRQKRSTAHSTKKLAAMGHL